MSPRLGLSIAIVIALAFGALVGMPSHPTPQPTIEEDMPQRSEEVDARPPPRSIAELRERIAAVLARDHIAGAAFALVDRNGPVFVGGVGVRDLASRAPMQHDTAFRVGSLSKSVVALGVMRLVDQGKLDVDRPLREILPDVIDNPWEAVAPVTLAQCLEHTAGLDDVRFNEIFADDEHVSVRETLALNPRSRRIRWRPGTRHAYSNIGYTIAARAIEVATGEPFDAYLRREILAPMGITDADFARTGTLAARLASGYMNDDDPVAFHPFAHRPSGSLLASADDFAKLAHFWIVRGDGYPPIVSPAGLARIEHSGTLPYPHVDSEYGFANYSDVTHPVMARGHDGGMPGFHSSFRYFPELGLGYALLLNSNYMFRGYFEIRSLLYAFLTKDRAAVAPPVHVASSEPPGATYFALASPRSEFFGFIDHVIMGWHVEDLGDRVHLAERRGERADLIPTADGAYRFPGECGSSVRFLTLPDGTRVMLTSFVYWEAASGWLADVRYVSIALALALVHGAPLWTICVLVLAALRRRRTLPPSLVMWPAVASLCCHAVPRLFDAAFFGGVIGKVHPLTVALCATTITFAVAAVATLVSVLRTCFRSDCPSPLALVMPMIFGLAFSALAVWLAAHGWIGLRTWAY